MQIIAHTPLANALDVAPGSPVMATFDADLSTTSVSTATFTLRSEQTGVYSGAFSFPAGDQLQFTPDMPFKPGETLYATGSPGLQSDLGASLTPYTWQFTAAAGAASGVMNAHPISPTFGAGNSFAVALGDLDGDGELDAVVANENMTAETVWLNDGSGAFSPHSGTPAFGAGSSWDVTLGDLDGDGDLDAVVANYFDQAETVWLNDGSGAFSPHPNTPAFGAGDSTAVALGDLDGDGDLDAVIANNSNQTETVWLNDGSGAFSPHSTTPAFGAGDSLDVALGDLDGDGDLDAVVANYDQAQTVWLNDGSGAFSPHLSTPSFGAGVSWKVALGDVDGDGDLDAVVANWGETQTVWLNDGSGAFSPHPGKPSFGAGYSLAVSLGDLDGDGDLDALVANYEQAQTVWLNDGSGAFSPHPTTPSFGIGNSRDVALGDLDGDGDLDALVANYGEAQTVWLNAPVLTVNAYSPAANSLAVSTNALLTATFSTLISATTVSTATFTLRSEQTGVYAGAFSFPAGDRLQFTPDMPFKPGETLYVTGSSGVHSNLGASLTPYTWQFTTVAGVASGVMNAHPISPTFGAMYSMAVALGDLDGDGDLDALVANYDHAQTVWLNNGSGAFSSHPTTPAFGAGYSTDVALGDLDGDGDLDAVVANDHYQAETVWINDGSGAFSPHPTTPAFGAEDSTAVALGDLDGDGDLDAVVTNDDYQTEMVWLNDGSGAFSPHPITPAFGDGYSLAVTLGDLDSDGDLDAVVANDWGEAETVWLNDGSGVFSPHPATPAFGAGDSTDVALGDLDGDGDLDAVVANYTEQAQTVWLNDGTGAFSPQTGTPSFGAGDSWGVSFGDLDGDGDLDALVANDNNQAQTAWLNDGSGVFSPHPVKPAFGAGNSMDVALGDLDGDGDLDALVVNGEDATVWLNANRNMNLWIPLILGNPTASAEPQPAAQSQGENPSLGGRRPGALLIWERKVASTSSIPEFFKLVAQRAFQRIFELAQPISQIRQIDIRIFG
jgi:hypothetical protein